MTWYCVYTAATGAAISFTTTKPSELPTGLAYVSVPNQPGENEAWDAATHTVVAYAAVPADPSGALYEIPTDGAWQWTYAVGPYRFAAKAAGVRSNQPADAAAQAYIKATAAVNDITAAISWATARRDSIGLALTAAGSDPATNATYQAASGVLAFLGGCL